jgi:hypothetical protein
MNKIANLNYNSTLDINNKQSYLTTQSIVQTNKAEKSNGEQSSPTVISANHESNPIKSSSIDRSSSFFDMLGLNFDSFSFISNNNNNFTTGNNSSNNSSSVTVNQPSHKAVNNPTTITQTSSVTDSSNNNAQTDASLLSQPGVIILTNPVTSANINNYNSQSK